MWLSHAVSKWHITHARGCPFGHSIQTYHTHRVTSTIFADPVSYTLQATCTDPPFFKSVRSGKRKGIKGIDKGQGKVSSPEYLYSITRAKQLWLVIIINIILLLDDMISVCFPFVPLSLKRYLVARIRHTRFPRVCLSRLPFLSLFVSTYTNRQTNRQTTTPATLD